MAAHRPHISRLLKIHCAIAANERPTIASLAEKCAVGERTIKRDITLLKTEFGAPIAFSRSNGKEGYYYEKPFSLAPEPFCEQELLALAVAQQIAESFQNTPFLPALKGALQKLQQFNSAPTIIAGDSLPDHISLLPKSPALEDTAATIHFNDILKAIEQRRQIRMCYYTISRDEECERVIDPYQIYHFDGLWYVYGYCHLRGENRDFAINRIRTLTLLATKFPPPDYAKIHQLLAGRYANITDDPVRVTIHFDAETAPRIRERIWHPSQEIEAQTDGSCLLTMTVTGLETITRWTLSFGRHALPLTPPAFVTRLNEEIAAMNRKNKANKKSAQAKCRKLTTGYDKIKNIN